MRNSTFFDFVVFTTVAFALLSFVPSSFGTRQRVTFFRNVNCTGTSQPYLGSQSGLNSTWVGSNATSVQIVGIWKLTLTSRTNQSSTVLGGSQPPSGKCFNKTSIGPNANASVFTAVEMIGPSEMTNNHIVLATGANFTGTVISRGVGGNDNSNYTLPSPLWMTSWAIFGNSPWATFRNDTNTTSCLPKSHPGSDGFTVGMRSQVLVYGYRRANPNECRGSGTTTTTRRPGGGTGSTTTKKPGSASSAFASLSLIACTVLLTSYLTI